jgi:hypothetical protein
MIFRAFTAAQIQRILYATAFATGIPESPAGRETSKPKRRLRCCFLWQQMLLVRGA